MAAEAYSFHALTWNKIEREREKEGKGGKWLNGLHERKEKRKKERKCERVKYEWKMEKEEESTTEEKKAAKKEKQRL